MIIDFTLVLMTKHMSEQIKFYKDVLELDLLFSNDTSAGFGLENRLFIVLRKDDAENSHHRANNSGPPILTFKCLGDIAIYTAKIQKSGFKVRNTLKLPELNIHYLFAEDYDGNEICLDFPLD